MAFFRVMGRQWIQDRETSNVRRAFRRQVISVHYNLPSARKSAKNLKSSGMARDVQIIRVSNKKLEKVM